MSPKKITKPLDIYVRVSDVKGREGDSFISPKEQVDRCRSAASARGLQIGEVLEELNVSGGKMDRPALNEALERIRDGISGGIIVARIDRFGRTVVGALNVIEEISEAGGVVITAEGDFDTSTAVGELVLNMMLSLAQFELRRIRDNWQAAKRRAVERGIHIAPRVPQGYVRGADGRLEPNGKSAETIRNAFEMAAQGDTYSSIAAYLNERELPVWGGDGVWQPNRIKRLLANRVYLGEARSGNGHINAGAHEPLVDPVAFEMAQRQTRVAPTITQAKDVALLASLVRCASCSFAMKYQAARGKTLAIYRCSRQTVHGTCEAPSSISATKLETFVVEQFLARASSISELQQLDNEDSVEAIETAFAAEGRYRAALTNVELRATIGDTDHDALLAALKEAWEDAKAAIPATVSASIGSATLTELIDELRANGDIKGLRELLSTGIQAVFVRPAASRAHNLPIEDRVKILWIDDEPVDVPHRGKRFEPQSFTW
jgi:site-specific DNA recombinase